MRFFMFFDYLKRNSFYKQNLWYCVGVGVVFCNTFFLVVIEATPASGVAPDIPNAQFDGERLKVLEGLVKEVSAEWCCHLADKDTLALFLPLNKGVSSLSKDAFVSLLEFCEEELHVKRVLICVNMKAVTNEILSCFKFVGFTPLHPDHYPSKLDPELLFAMVYNV